MTNLIKPSPQPILIVSIFLHLCSNEIPRVHGPIRAHRPIENSLGAVLLTENSLDMLVEHSQKALGAMDSLEIPEAPSIPAFSYDLGLRCNNCAGRFFLLLKSLYEFRNDRLEILEVFSMFNIIDRSTSQLVRRCL